MNPWNPYMIWSKSTILPDWTGIPEEPKKLLKKLWKNYKTFLMINKLNPLKKKKKRLKLKPKKSPRRKKMLPSKKTFKPNLKSSPKCLRTVVGISKIMKVAPWRLKKIQSISRPPYLLIIARIPPFLSKENVIPFLFKIVNKWNCNLKLWSVDAKSLEAKK